MFEKSHKPHYLPQMNAPFEIVLQKLDEEGVEYNSVKITPNKSDNINASQPFTLSDEVGKVELNDTNPIWISNDQNIIDGHHRYFKALFDKVPIMTIQIKLNDKDACRVLNKIQDIYEYEQKQQMEEEVSQDVINTDNQIDSGVSDGEFLDSLEEDNTNIQSEKPSANQKTITAYRKEPIKENSVVGNFFSLKPIEGFNKYEIDFDNLLDTHALGVTYKDGQEPIDILAKIWFPHINFEKISEQYGIEPINLKNKAIAEKAMKLGYDGILHRDKLVQGLK